MLSSWAAGQTAPIAPVASAQVELLSPPTSQPTRFHPSVGLPEQRVSYRPCPPWPTTNTAPPLLLTVTIPPASVPLIFAHRQWRAGLIMADLIAAAASPPFDVKGLSVLELGCGTAVPGMVAAKLGQCARALVTDYASPPLIATLTSNVRSNFTPDEVKTRIRPAGFTWGSSTEDLEDLVDGLARHSGIAPSYRWDRILLADCLWDPLSHADLLTSITKLLESGGHVLVVSGLHTGREKLVNFIRRARRSGLALVDVGGQHFPALDDEEQEVARAEQAKMTQGQDALYDAPPFVYELELADDDDGPDDADVIDTGSQPRLTGRRRAFVIDERKEEQKERGGVHVRNRWITIWGLTWAA